MILFFILQFVLVLVGISLIAAGVRGRLKLGDPRCAKCSYDLRTFGERPVKCSECGADLTVPGSVFYSERVRKPALAYVGAVLILIGIVVPFVLIIFMTFGAPTKPLTPITGLTQRVDAQEAAMMSTDQLVEAISINFNNPRLWNEIQARLATSGLSEEDITNVVEQIIEHIKLAPSGERIVGLSRAEPFVKTIIAEDMIRASLLQSLILSVYPDVIEILDLDRAEQSDYTFVLGIENPLKRRRFDMNTVVVIHSVKIAGQEQSIEHGGQSHYIGNVEDGKVISLFEGDPFVHVSLPELEVGDHDVFVDLEWAVFAPEATEDLPFRWRSYPAKWPEPLYRQRREFKRNLAVVPRGTPVTDLVDDPVMEDAFKSSIIVTGVTMMPSLQGNGLVARVELVHGIVPHLDYVFRVAIEVDGFPLIFDQIADNVVGITKGAEPIDPETTALRDWMSEFTLPESATGKEQINIHLIPVTDKNSLSYLRSITRHIDRLWARKLILKNVPKRFVQENQE